MTKCCGECCGKHLYPFGKAKRSSHPFCERDVYGCKTNLLHRTTSGVPATFHDLPFIPFAFMLIQKHKSIQL